MYKEYAKLSAKAAIIACQAAATIAGLLADNPTRQLLSEAMQETAADLQKEYLKLVAQENRGI